LTTPDCRPPTADCRTRVRRALALALLIAAAIGPAHAEPGEGPLVYEKWLDLSLNPPPAGAPVPPADDGEATRVVHGHAARNGAWPSVVSLAVVKDGIGTRTCAGTAIGRRWVLTAAHCVFKRREGGVSLIRAATVYAGSNLRFDPGGGIPFEGEAIRVRRVTVHHDFARSPGMRNDIALLELEKDAAAELQTLAAGGGVDALLAPGSVATVVGWGVTAPVPAGASTAKAPQRFPYSRLLNEARLPIAPPEACAAFLGRPVDPVELCAGDGSGGADTCRGDSGGPLLVGRAGEAIQAGIVSWGPGCAQPKTYGVYTSVGRFESWIRGYVRDALFAEPKAAPPESGSAAPPHGGIDIDMAEVGCARSSVPAATAPLSAMPALPGAARDRFSAGTCVRLRVTSAVAGHLAVFSRDANGEVVRLYPNRVTGSAPDGTTPTRVLSGQTVAIPGPADEFDLRVVTPVGRAEVVAVVVPGTHPPTAESLAQTLADAARDLKAMPRAQRAVGVRAYDVVE
jgi:secreted trypsin-like serine protease